MFQTVPLHSMALDEAIYSVQLPTAVSNALSSESEVFMRGNENKYSYSSNSWTGSLQVIRVSRMSKLLWNGHNTFMAQIYSQLLHFI
jgi:hypothetical protein